MWYRTSVLAIALLAGLPAIFAQNAPDLTDDQRRALEEQKQASQRALEVLDALQDQQEALDAVARAKFLPGCEAVVGKASYCSCAYEKLPVGFTWFSEQPWLTFVATMHSRSFVGAVDKDKDNDQERLNIYLTARSAVQECAAAN